MQTDRDSNALADGLAETLKVDGETLRAGVELYRQLAAGKPVRLDNVASVLAVSVGDLKETLEKWAISALEYDEKGRVVGFGGLTLKPTAHRFQVSEHPLYTWCAFDTLFIPRLLNKTAQVTSTCPVSGRSIHLSVGPDGIEQCRPKGAYISLLTYPASQLKGNVKSCFCCHIHFFASQDTAHTWLSHHEGASVLPVNEASRLVQSVTERAFLSPGQVPKRRDDL
jgi:alkylmercury lyase